MPELWPQWITGGDSFESADPDTVVYGEEGNSRVTCEHQVKSDHVVDSVNDEFECIFDETLKAYKDHQA